MRILTGLQSSGAPHIGNYLGMIRPAVDLQNKPENDCFYFIADLHSFTSQKDPKIFAENQKFAAVDWLVLGIDPEKSVFYRQSDVADLHTELTWYLLCFTPMGMLERAHSYKDKKDKGLEANAGLFTYPILMAADILLYDANLIPVGKDQKQHVEMARDLAIKINHHFGEEIFTIPKPSIDENVQTIPGLDGQKMSKSYGNFIGIFEEKDAFRKKIMSIKTESVPLGEPLDPDNCLVFTYHKLFKNPRISSLEKEYRDGSIGYGKAKEELFELLWDFFSEARERREHLLQNPELVSKILSNGAEKARDISEKKLQKMREKMGLAS